MKKTWITIILSILFSGTGHIYIGNITKGLILIVLMVLTQIIARKVPLLSILSLIIYVYAIVDSYKSLKIKNKEMNSN